MVLPLHIENQLQVFSFFSWVNFSLLLMVLHQDIIMKLILLKQCHIHIQNQTIHNNCIMVLGWLTEFFKNNADRDMTYSPVLFYHQIFKREDIKHCQLTILLDIYGYDCTMDKAFSVVSKAFSNKLFNITKTECFHMRILKAIICDSIAYGLLPLPYSSPEKYFMGLIILNQICVFN